MNNPFGSCKSRMMDTMPLSMQRGIEPDEFHSSATMALYQAKQCSLYCLFRNTLFIL